MGRSPGGGGYTSSGEGGSASSGGGGSSGDERGQRGGSRSGAGVGSRGHHAVTVSAASLRSGANIMDEVSAADGTDS